MKMIVISEEDLATQLAEGVHTGFRKAIDSPRAMPIHRAIADLAQHRVVPGVPVGGRWDRPELHQGGATR